MLPLVPLLTALSTATPTDSALASPAVEHVAETSFMAGLGAAGAVPVDDARRSAYDPDDSAFIAAI